MNIKADPTEFAGKRVLISGGTKSAGRATVDRFLAGGARVITAARGALEPIEVEFIQADLTTAEGGKPVPRPRSSAWAESIFWLTSLADRRHPAAVSAP